MANGYFRIGEDNTTHSSPQAYFLNDPIGEPYKTIKLDFPNGVDYFDESAEEVRRWDAPVVIDIPYIIPQSSVPTPYYFIGNSSATTRLGVNYSSGVVGGVKVQAIGFTGRVSETPGE